MNEKLHYQLLKDKLSRLCDIAIGQAAFHWLKYSITALGCFTVCVFDQTMTVFICDYRHWQRTNVHFSTLSFPNSDLIFIKYISYIGHQPPFHRYILISMASATEKR